LIIVAVIDWQEIFAADFGALYTSYGPDVEGHWLVQAIEMAPSGRKYQTGLMIIEAMNDWSSGLCRMLIRIVGESHSFLDPNMAHASSQYTLETQQNAVEQAFIDTCF